jgi:anthranilate phosphoribosyltransferase
MKTILEKLFHQHLLDRAEARDVLLGIADERYALSQVAAFLTVYRMRSISVEELLGFRDALLLKCRAVDLGGIAAIDLCGTGGDQKNTFNISTLASLVVAAAGYPVAKHCNYGVSSNCGSSNVMEYLGYRFPDAPDQVQKQVEIVGISFMHAPLFHPAMKAVAPVRKSIGVHTFFNMLGPLVNPAAPQYQLVGVYSLELARLYQYVFQEMQDHQYSIVHSLDGYDEVSLTGPFQLFSNEHIAQLDAVDLTLQNHPAEAIVGGENVADAARIFQDILQGKGTIAQNEAVFANAALAIQRIRPNTSITDCIAEASASLLGGKARQKLMQLITLSQS